MKTTQQRIGVLAVIKRAVALSMIVLFVLVSTGCMADANEPKPANHIGILIDGSMTFAARRGDAVKRARELVEKIAEKPGRRHQGSYDRVVLIAVDAMPSVLWRGTLEELRNSDRESWIRRFEARSDFSYCTDVDGAFRMAAEELGPSWQQIHKYLFVFSDLQHEPPTKSLRRCEQPRFGPDESFPWEQVQDTSISALWTAAEQKLAWQRKIDSHGLSKSFHVYVDSESAEVTPTPPPAARRIVTEEERRQIQANLASSIWRTIKIICGVVALCLVIPTGVIFVAARRRRASRRNGAIALNGQTR